MPTVNIDTSKCNGDGVCVEVCPVGVYELKDVQGYEGKKSVVIKNDECIACRACEIQCATQAITVSD